MATPSPPAQASPSIVRRRIRPSALQAPAPRSLALAGNQTDWHTNNVLVPFNTRDPKTGMDRGEPEEFLRNIFPGTIHVMESVPRRWLNFYVRQLPSTPWPVTVGGLPITIRTGTQGRGLFFPLPRRGMQSISIFQEFKSMDDNYFSDEDFRLLVRGVDRYFHTHHPNIKLCEVIITMQNWIYVVLDGYDLNVNSVAGRLPGWIAKCVVGYLHESDLHRPARQKDSRRMCHLRQHPSSGVSDNTAYNTLRPGVMVWSDQVLTHGQPSPVTWTTTAGVLVKSIDTHQTFMTVASHAVGESGIVYQPRADDSKRIVGQAVDAIPFTNIALVQLESGVNFVNATFEDENGNTPTLARLLGEQRDDLSPRNQFPEVVYLNSPFSGIMMGAVVAKSMAIEPMDPDGEEPRLIPYEWTYTGQAEAAGDSPCENSRAPPSGVCGSAVWDDEGVVVSFFQYYIAEGKFAGFCVSVAASEVVKAGYRLAPGYKERTMKSSRL